VISITSLCCEQLSTDPAAGERRLGAAVRALRHAGVSAQLSTNPTAGERRHGAAVRALTEAGSWRSELGGARYIYMKYMYSGALARAASPVRYSSLRPTSEERLQVCSLGVADLARDGAVLRG